MVHVCFQDNYFIQENAGVTNQYFCFLTQMAGSHPSALVRTREKFKFLLLLLNEYFVRSIEI